MVATGLSIELVISPVVRRAIYAVSVTLLVVGAAMTAVWWLAYLMQLRPLNRLSRIAERIGAGDFSARAGIEPSVKAPRVCHIVLIIASEPMEYRREGTTSTMAGRHDRARSIPAQPAPSRYRPPLACKTT
ncbi:MAG: hypothetical protein H7Y08_00450 [Rhizobiaceae bacterium]|nr:hypothetical protein [Rhizobiaceae bacterium]